MIQGLKEKAMFWKDHWPSRFIVLRNMGDTFAPEIVPAVRIKYDDRHDKHLLKTGEELPAAPRRYVLNGFNGTPTVFAIEADEDQMVVFKPEVKEDPSKINELSDLEKYQLDTDMSGDEVYDLLEDKNFDAVQFSILENKDERLTYLAEELELAQNKYVPSSIMKQYPNLVILVVTALCIVLILYGFNQAFGSYMPVLENFNANMGQFLQNAANSGSGTPPG